jgi:transposase
MAAERRSRARAAPPRGAAGRGGAGHAARAGPGGERPDARGARRGAARRAGGAAGQRPDRLPGAPAARAGPRAKALRAAEPDRADVAAAREAWRAELAAVDPARLVFLDESGVDTRLTRTHARAASGRRAPGKVPCGRWRRLTVVGALAGEGVVAAMSIAAATSTRVFLAFVQEVLVPALRQRPDAIVVMDNLAAHKAEVVRGAFDRAGLSCRHLPACSPDLDPIEPCWSKLKARLRARAARALDALEAELGPALATITPEDARGWFRLAGYPAPG